MEIHDYLIALLGISGLGRVRLRMLLEKYTDPKEIWSLTPQDLEDLGLPVNIIDSWKRTRSKNPRGRSEALLSKGINIVSVLDETYPKLLRQTSDPPILLYYRGQLNCLNRDSIAIVGSRKATSYGYQVTESLTDSLVYSGLVIVSGLAQGIDTCVHRTAIDSGGLTVAVLAGGLDNISPKDNEHLAERIVSQRGIILSESPPETQSFSGLFPSRNRIIAGLARAVLVTEATVDSGSLITAKEALDYGREVFAVPGPITTQSSLGCLLLIKQGATLVSRVEDILEGLNISPISDRQIEALELTEVEEQIVKALRLEQKHIDQLIQETGLSISEIASVLLKLELKGVISNLSPGMYVATMKT